MYVYSFQVGSNIYEKNSYLHLSRPAGIKYYDNSSHELTLLNIAI